MPRVTMPSGAPDRIKCQSGQTYAAQPIGDGRRAMDLQEGDLEEILRGPQGKSWSAANPHLISKMLAPEGTTSYSHDGQEFQIGKDRLVTVSLEVASILRSHGFTAAPSR
jgi:hypothetical protein